MSTKLPVPPSLVFAIANSRGVYVPLIASGVSRGAKIPTGYDVTVDLIRRLAAVSGETPDAPADWYVANYGEPASYSHVVARLGLTDAGRMSILRGYLEPTPEEAALGEKRPTLAHRAIADLARRGYFRVILTTNFDQLIETALRDAGLAPRVVSSEAQAAALGPLVHAGLIVVKLNGDYVEQQGRNLAAELAAYPPAMTALLDRILSDHALIVCGWSAQYDVGLREAIGKSPEGRFAMYWAHRGPLTAEAAELCEARGAVTMEIADADAFFGDVNDGVLALERFPGSSSGTHAIQLKRLKRHLQEPGHRIEFEELLVEAARSVAQRIAGHALSMNEPTPTHESIVERGKIYEEAVAPLLDLLVCSGHWGEPIHHDAVVRAIAQVVPQDEMGAGNTLWLGMRFYPGTLAMYSAGVGAVSRRHFDLVARLLQAGSIRTGSGTSPWVEFLHAWFMETPDAFRGYAGLEKHRTAVSARIEQVLESPAKEIMLDGDAYRMAFDEWELLVAMATADIFSRTWAPRGVIGAFSWRFRNRPDMNAVDRFRSQLDKEQDAWGYTAAGLFGGSAARARELLDIIARQPEMRRLG